MLLIQVLKKMIPASWKDSIKRTVRRTRQTLFPPRNILVYQMGKVGSTSIFRSLKALFVNDRVFHVHRLNPANIQRTKEFHIQQGINPQNEEKGLWIYHNIIQPKQKVQAITMTREPVSRNISAYFENVHKLPEFSDELLTDKALAFHINKFIENYSHYVPLDWFDWEIKETLGIDVYQTYFPFDRGWQTYESGPFQLLVLRSEDSDAVKQEAIKEFLGIEHFELKNDNLGENKHYYEIYQLVKNKIQLPSSYLDRMYNSKFAQHFYSTNELKSFRKRWERQTV